MSRRRKAKKAIQNQETRGAGRGIKGEGEETEGGKDKDRQESHYKRKKRAIERRRKVRRNNKKLSKQQKRSEERQKLLKQKWLQRKAVAERGWNETRDGWWEEDEVEEKEDSDEESGMAEPEREEIVLAEGDEYEEWLVDEKPSEGFKPELSALQEAFVWHGLGLSNELNTIQAEYFDEYCPGVSFDEWEDQRMIYVLAELKEEFELEQVQSMRREKEKSSWQRLMKEEELVLALDQEAPLDEEEIQMLDRFRDKISLAVDWIKQIRKSSSEIRPRGGWCAVCDNRVGRRFLAPHPSKDCFVGFEDRSVYLARTYRGDNHRCPICSHTIGTRFHRCPKGPQWLECEECARNGIRGRRDHRSITGYCQGLRNFRNKHGMVPSLETLLEEERRIPIEFPLHWVQWHAARNVSKNEWNQWRKACENRVSKTERHQLEWEEYERAVVQDGRKKKVKSVDELATDRRGTV